MRASSVLVAAAVITAGAGARAQSKNSFSVSVHVDATSTAGAVRPIWRFFGADEPNYFYMPNGRKLAAELGKLDPGGVYFRAHNLLTSGDGTPALKWGSTGIFREDSNGKPIYTWAILDRIFDAYREAGLKPYVEIGFMPEALSSSPRPYQHHWTPQGIEPLFTGWAYPPKNYEKWNQLVFEWTRHCVDRYGPREVESWFWETWNEANIGYWKGSPEEFQKLHDFAVAGVRRALPSARVGGPDVAGSGGSFMRSFLEHCLHGTNFATGQVGTPIDFVSFHAKGSPIYTNGHVRMGIAAQLGTISEGFRLIASFPELKGKTVVIGESDPEGCAACEGPQLAYRNGTMYSSYTAAAFARKIELAELHGINLEGALTWAFEFEDQPYFAEFRSLASNGIDKPVLNVFRMFALMKGRRLVATSDGEVPLNEILAHGVRTKPDVGAVASLDARRLCVLLWHYHDDDLPGPAAETRLTIENLQVQIKEIRIREFRVDEDHSNSYMAWRRIGSPQEPTPEQYSQLERAGMLAEVQPPNPSLQTNHNLNIPITLPRQAVALLILDW